MKTIMKTIVSAFALSLFVVSTSFAQSTGTVQDAQSDDTYTQDGTQDGTYTQDGTTGTQGDVQDDRYTTQDGMESEDYGTQNQDQMSQSDENKTQIAQEELPENVSQAIEEGEYAEWTVAEVYKVDEQNEKLYEIHFQNEQGQTETEKFKENGEVAR